MEVKKKQTHTHARWATATLFFSEQRAHHIHKNWTSPNGATSERDRVMAENERKALKMPALEDMFLQHKHNCSPDFLMRCKAMAIYVYYTCTQRDMNRVIQPMLRHVTWKQKYKTPNRISYTNRFNDLPQYASRLSTARRAAATDTHTTERETHRQITTENSNRQWKQCSCTLRVRIEPHLSDKDGHIYLVARERCVYARRLWGTASRSNENKSRARLAHSTRDCTQTPQKQQVFVLIVFMQRMSWRRRSIRSGGLMLCLFIGTLLSFDFCSVVQNVPISMDNPRPRRGVFGILQYKLTLLVNWVYML